MKNQNGQTIIILLLIMLVALSIGLAITQRSVVDLSSSNVAEQSARAFSAAEAGLEQAIQQGTTISNLNLGNQSSANVTISAGLPRPHQALEYPPIGKKDEAQFWLADPYTLNAAYPAGANLNVYFGNVPPDYTSPDNPALEVDIITKNSSGTYVTTRGYYDTLSSRASTNGFTNLPSVSPATCPLNSSPPKINTSNSTGYNPSNPNDPAYQDRQFRCYVPITLPSGNTPIMIRARILYSNVSQPIAVQPDPTQVNNPAYSLPYQAKIYTSVGVSGNTQKRIQVFKLDSVVPPYFDFSIFSAGSINK